MCLVFFCVFSASKKDDVENIALYVGLCVAFAVLVTAVVIIIFLVRRKHYHQPGVYDMDLPNSGETAYLKKTCPVNYLTNEAFHQRISPLLFNL